MRTLIRLQQDPRVQISTRREHALADLRKQPLAFLKHQFDHIFLVRYQVSIARYFLRDSE